MTLNRRQAFSPLLIALVAMVGLAACGTTGGGSPSGPEARTVPSADGTPIHYQTAGQGDLAIVFVHGWSCDLTYWDKQIAYFQTGHRVVAIDLAGHGGSGMARADYTMAAFGADVAAVVEALGLDRVVLVGHSMGGQVVVEASRLLGDRVIGLVGVDTFETGWTPPEGEGLEAFLKLFQDDFSRSVRGMVSNMFMLDADEEDMLPIMNDMAAAPPEVAINAMKNLLQWQAENTDLTALPVPLININADPSGLAEPANDNILLIHKVGHFIPQMAPTAFNQALTIAIQRFDAP